MYLCELFECECIWVSVCACEYIWLVHVRVFGCIWMGNVSENVCVFIYECGFIWTLCRWCIWVFCMFESVSASGWRV